MHWFFRFLCCILRCGPLPLHLSVIMDGNRRYARSHQLPSLSGHVAGYSSLLALLEWSRELGVRSVSAWAWSIDNFHRSGEEVAQLMGMMVDKMGELLERVQQLHRHRVRVNLLGNTSLLPDFVQRCIDKVREGMKREEGRRGGDRGGGEGGREESGVWDTDHTAQWEGEEGEGDNGGDGSVHINLCVAYTSQQEMTDAAAIIGRALQAHAEEAQRMRPQEVGVDSCRSAASSSSSSTASSTSTPSSPHSPASPASPPLSPSSSPPSPCPPSSAPPSPSLPGLSTAPPSSLPSIRTCPPLPSPCPTPSPSPLFPPPPHLHPLDVTPTLFFSSLYSSTSLPSALHSPSLLLRTSGEHRLSDFSLLQLRTASVVWVRRLWPEVRFLDLVGVVVGWQRGEEGRRREEEEVREVERRGEEEREEWVKEWLRHEWRGQGGGGGGDQEGKGGGGVGGGGGKGGGRRGSEAGGVAEDEYVDEWLRRRQQRVHEYLYALPSYALI